MLRFVISNYLFFFCFAPGSSWQSKDSAAFNPDDSQSCVFGSLGHRCWLDDHERVCADPGQDGKT